MNSEKKEKAFFLSRYFLLVCFIALAINLVIRMLDSNLASFASNVWGSKSLGGYLTTAFNIGGICMAFFTGRLINRLGKKKCLIFGSLVFAFALLIMGIWQLPTVCLPARVLQGVAKGIMMVSMTSVIADVIDKSHMNAGMGIYNLAPTIAFAFGPMLGLNLSESRGYQAMFFVGVVLILLALALSFGENYEKNPEYQKIQSSEELLFDNQNYKGIWKFIEKCALWPSVMYTICFAGYSGILVFTTVYAQELLGFSSAQIGFFYTAAAVSMLIARLTCNRIADRYGVLYLIVPGHISMVIAIVFLAFLAKHNYGFFIVAGLLYGVGNVFLMPSLNACAVVDSPGERSNYANATFYFFQDFGILFASAIFGVVIDRAVTETCGYTIMWVSSICILGFSLILCSLLFNNQARERRRSKNGITIH